ncbi:MAG TPA: flagellar hook capping FlgD N-terminal domain-containing protein [Roseomonas sp.]|jgi:flagellar basal-body rod modification protein FlgD
MSGTVNGSSPAQAAANAAQQAAQGPQIASDFNTFLTLLTTQLKNQSPDSPLDSNQMMAQLTQFASVEQQINMNQNLQQLINLQQVGGLTSAADLMGHRVEVQSDSLSLQNGRADLRLPARGAATTARVTIADSNGRTIRTADVSLNQGTQDWTWDGRDNNGNAVTDGVYRVGVAGIGSNGAPTSQAPAFTVIGTATGASRSGNDIVLNLGGLTLPYNNLRAVVE